MTVLALAGIIAFTLIVLYALNQHTARVTIHAAHDHETARAWITAMHALDCVIERQQAHMERVLIGDPVSTTPSTQPDPREAYEAAMETLDDFHGQGDSIDTPDWTDAFVPREATGRVGGLRPGQSPIPGADGLVGGQEMGADGQVHAEGEYEWAE